MNTMRSNVVKLRQQGYKVKYRTRKDGGILITSINGKKFSQAKGNAYARSLLGERLSSARSYQLARLNPYTISWKDGKKVRVYRNMPLATDEALKQGLRTRPALRKHAKIPEVLQKELKKVQRLWRKGGGALQKGHTTIAGSITLSNIRYQYETYGMDIAMERLQKARRYAEGYAYEENIDWFRDSLKDLLKDADFDWSGISEIIELLDSDEVRAQFREEWMQALHEELYNITRKGGALSQADIDDAVAHMKAIIE